MMSTENAYEIDLIRKRQQGNNNKISHLFHIVEHQTNIMERFDHRLEKIRKSYVPRAKFI